MLTLIDEYTREWLAVEVGISIKSEKVRAILQRVCQEKGFPERMSSLFLTFYFCLFTFYFP